MSCPLLVTLAVDTESATNTDLFLVCLSKISLENESLFQ